LRKTWALIKDINDSEVITENEVCGTHDPKVTLKYNLFIPAYTHVIVFNKFYI